MGSRSDLVASDANDPEQTSNDVRSPGCLRRLYNDTTGKARSNPGEIPNRRTGNGKCHRKIAPGFRTGKNEPAAAHSELEPRGSRGGRIAPAARAAGKPLEALYVNHISYEVNDYKKVRDFYVDLLGMKVTEDDGKQCRLVFGNNILVPRNRANGGPAKVDHIAYTVANWDAEKEGLEEELKRRNLQYTGSAKTSFQVKDPEGMGVQFGGLHQ